MGISVGMGAWHEHGHGHGHGDGKWAFKRCSWYQMKGICNTRDFVFLDFFAKLLEYHRIPLNLPTNQPKYFSPPLLLDFKNRARTIIILISGSERTNSDK